MDGSERFLMYVDSMNGAPGDAMGRRYPGLTSLPFHDPARVGIASYVEKNYDAIRAEVCALDPVRFHRENEPIPRDGEWDVVHLYNGGRRFDDACAACPTLIAGIDNPELRAIRTPPGLIYVSRMRGSTHIQAHSGPTNLRLRCHLGISVPTGDCAIRVGQERRAWQEGRCLLFDDSYEHEAWNHTDKDRVVVIVDVWHPDLTDRELGWLSGLQRHVSTMAERRVRGVLGQLRTSGRLHPVPEDSTASGE